MRLTGRAREEQKGQEKWEKHQVGKTLEECEHLTKTKTKKPEEGMSRETGYEPG